jgi:hypothetical protein
VTLTGIVLAGVLLAAPLAAEAQPTAHRVGLFAQDLQPGLLETLQDQLQRQGYVEGRNITLEVRNAAGRSNLLRCADGKRRVTDSIPSLCSLGHVLTPD